MSRRMYAPGPFRADQLRSGDPYELSNGHAIRVAPAGSQHGAATVAAGLVLQSDPAVKHAGFDVGYSPDPGTLRAPDVSVLPSAPGPGWTEGVPALAVEYADTGQDEEKLAEKIADLLSRGTGGARIRAEGLDRARRVNAKAELRARGSGAVFAPF